MNPRARPPVAGEGELGERGAGPKTTLQPTCVFRPQQCAKHRARNWGLPVSRTQPSSQDVHGLQEKKLCCMRAGAVAGRGGGRKRGHTQCGTPEKAPGSRAKDEVGQILSTWVLGESKKQLEQVRAWRREACRPRKRRFQHLTPASPPRARARAHTSYLLLHLP